MEDGARGIKVLKNRRAGNGREHREAAQHQGSPMNERWKCHVAIWLACLGCSAHAATDPTVPPTQSVAGQSQADWSKVWWQWAASFDQSDSPITDQTGELCGAKQSGPVWFLAGTYGTHRTVRLCKVPRGKHLFFPLINYVVTRPLDREVDCGSVMHNAARLTDGAHALILEVDGKRVERLGAFRQASKCFNIAELSTPKQFVFPSAANGYYVMLKPLGPGTHVISFGGALPGMLQAVTYTVVVE